jgi:hypothetical protein
MKSFEFMPRDPVELARLSAEQAKGGQQPESPSQLSAVEFELTSLEAAAQQMGFLGNNYFVQAGRAFAIPASFEADETVIINDYRGLTFEGVFATFSRIVIGRIIGDREGNTAVDVHALSLAFSTATLLPNFESLADPHILHVPILAIASIDQTL